MQPWLRSGWTIGPRGDIVLAICRCETIPAKGILVAESENNPDSAASAALNIDAVRNHYRQMRQEIAKVIIGQERVIDEMLIALFSGGHVLLEGVPGLAKTLLISSLADVMDLSFNRIQFTPDLMPSDITGTEVIEEDKAKIGRAQV